jgi:hypothetical protein
VSSRDDPPRLRTPGSGASESARALLERSRAELPDAEQLARLAQRLPRLGGGGGHAPSEAPSPTPPASPPLPAAPAAAGSMVPSALIGAAVGLAMVWGMWQRDASTPSAQVPLPPASAEARASTRTPAAGVPAPPAPSSAAAQAPDPLRSPAPSASLSTSTPSPRAAPTEAAASSKGGSLGSTEGPSPGDAETEIELLLRAQQSLPLHPAAALAAAEEHRRRFPGGGLAQEREVIAVSALVALGRRDEAQVLAKRFAESYPRSAHRAGIEALLRSPPAGRLDQKGEQEGAPTP